SQARHRDPPARWAPLTVFHALCEAMHEGLAMHREYEALRSRGIAHEAALRQALAIGAAVCVGTKGHEAGRSATLIIIPTAGGSNEMGDTRQCEGRPRGLSLAHSHVCRS